MIAISYRRDDSLPIAGRLYDRLQATFGKPNIFMDFDSIRPGLDFRSQIKDTIDRANVVIALIGPRWTGPESDGSHRIDEANDFVRLEIAHALKRNIPIIPVLINNTPMPKAEMLPDDMQEVVYRHALPLDSGVDFHQHADRVIAGVRNLVDANLLPQPDGEKAKLTEPVDSSRPGRRSVMLVLIVALMGTIGAGGWIIFTHSGKNGGLQVVTPRSTPSGESPIPTSARSLAQNSSVEISSQPVGARILHNGVVIGTTPLRRDDFGAGAAKFLLVADGYLPHELEARIDPVHGFKGDVSLVQAAPLYAGAVHLQGGDKNAPGRPIAIALNPNLTSGTMTQSSKRGDFVVRFSGLWEGSELHAVSRDVVAQPAGIQWTPESFVLRFSGDGRRAEYECVADGKTYVADLSAKTEFFARLAHLYKGTVAPSNTPIRIMIAADRKSGTVTQTSKSGDTVVAFTGVWDDKVLHAVTGDVLSKPEKVQWKPESFTLRFSDDGRRASYSCNDGGQILTAELSSQP